MSTSIYLYVGTSPAMAGVQTPQINKRFWNKSSLMAWLNSGITFKTISVDYEVYSSDRFFDVPLSTFNTSGDTSGVYYGSFNNISFIKVNSKFSEEGSVNEFFAFVTHYEVNHIDKTVRFFFMVDWWDTLLYNNIDVRPTGEVERAHINDTTRNPSGSYHYPNPDGHTSNLDYPLYNNDIHKNSRLLTNRYWNVYTFEESQGIDRARSENYELALAATQDIAFAYLVWKNTADIEGESGILDDSVSETIKLPYPKGYGNLDNDIVIPTSAIVRIVIIDKINGRMLLPTGTDEITVSKTFSYELGQVTNETLLAIHISNEIPAGMKLYRGYVINEFGHYEWAYSFKIKVDNSAFAIENFKVGTTGQTCTCIKMKGNFNAPIVSLDGIFASDFYCNNRPIENFTEDITDEYEKFLKSIIKPKMYPYEYFSLSCANTDKIINTVLYNTGDLQDIQIVEHYATGDIICYIPNSVGYSNDYLSVMYISTNSIFPPYFTDSWLDRINSLEQGAMTAIKAGLSIIGGEVAAIGGVAQMGNATNPIGQIAGAGAIAGGVMQAVSGAINFGYSLHRLAREYRLRDEGYYQNGNVNSIDITSYMSSNIILAVHNYLSDKALRRIQELIARYGETTTLFIEEILKDHQRSHFNFIQTAGCVCRPETPVNVLPLKDIEQMFDSGVYLFTYKSDDTDYTPQTAFNVDGVINYQENFPDEED